MNPEQMAQLATDLAAAKQVLIGRGRYTKGAVSAKTGECCPVMAIAFGVYDSDHFVISGEGLVRTNACRAALLAQAPNFFGIVEWNENPETTDADVFAAFDRAIAEADEEEI